MHNLGDKISLSQNPTPGCWITLCAAQRLLSGSRAAKLGALPLKVFWVSAIVSSTFIYAHFNSSYQDPPSPLRQQTDDLERSSSGEQ